MSLTNVLTVAAIGLATIVVLVIASSWVLARLWCKPRRIPPAKTPADLGLPFESITFSSHGVPINGWFIPAAADASPQPVIVLAHGWSSNATEMLLLARVLHKANFALLLYDSRGHGASGQDGPITIRKFAEDIVAGIDYLETRSDVDGRRLGVLGRSMGGSGAIVAASTEPRIRAVVSCSSFADTEALTRDYLATLHVPPWPLSWLVNLFIARWLGTSVRSVAPQNRIGQITAPILLIHGETDRYVSPSNLDLLYARAPRERTERLMISNRGHTDLLRDARCSQKIVAFLSEN
jgi:dipeptidyl aminopeptidase/acylaminoacyl peptidase